MDDVGLRQPCVSFSKAPRGQKRFIPLFKVHSTLDMPLGWSYTFKWATIPTKCCHLSTGVCPAFHHSVVREAERVVEDRDRERRVKWGGDVCHHLGHPVVCGSALPGRLTFLHHIPSLASALSGSGLDFPRCLLSSEPHCMEMNNSFSILKEGFTIPYWTAGNQDLLIHYFKLHKKACYYLSKINKSHNSPNMTCYSSRSNVVICL